MFLRRLSESKLWMGRYLIGLMGALLAMLLIGLLSWELPGEAQISLHDGNVAPMDVRAPRRITYVSDLLTNQARDRAEQQVQDQFDGVESRVRRQQKKLAEDILEYIQIVLGDPYADEELRTDYLLEITGINMTTGLIAQILQLSPAQMDEVVQNVPIVLDISMRDVIRENNLIAARRRVPALIDTDVDEDASIVIAELVKELIRPNSFLNTERTEADRLLARDQVPNVEVTIEANEVIVRGGDVVSEEDVEALNQFGVLQNEWEWWGFIRSALLTLTILTIVAVAIQRLRPETLTNTTEMAILLLICAIWIIAARFMIVVHPWLPFLYPLAALGMLLAVLIDLRVSILITIGFMILLQYLGRDIPAIMTYSTAGALIGASVLGRAERLTAFLWAGLLILVSNIVTFLAFRAPFTSFSASEIQLFTVILLNAGLSASVALLGYFILGNLFGITTSLQLTELSRPTHPLLRQLLLKAPGTYHHTIVVSNLAERAAATIGADAFLSRVGAYYHDIGKTVRPYFFTENIADGQSPHDKLDPQTSAQIIISHVSDGLDLAEKYHIPQRIREFIREHHGRSVVRYFYMQACAAAGEDEVVNQDDFRYGGPSPRSKETGIMLLADTCEAAVRSIRPSTRDELEALVHRLVDQHIEEGELNDSNLTFREVQQVKEVFVRVLEGVHHPRISYPDAESISSGPLREAEKSSMRNGSSAEAADDFVPGSMDEFETETGTEVSSETGR